MTTKHCKECGKELTGPFQWKFCCNSCASKYNWRVRKDPSLKEPEEKRYCKECGKELKDGWKIFCNKSCAGKYNWRKRKQNGWSLKGVKTIKRCSACGKEIEVGLYAPNPTILCDDCKLRRQKERRKVKGKNTHCKECGKELNKEAQVTFCSKSCSAKYTHRTTKRSYDKKPWSERRTPCKYCGRKGCKHKICKWLSNSGLRTVRLLGLDMTKVGTIEIFEEMGKLVDRMRNEYEVKGKSTVELSEEFGITDMPAILRRLGVQVRSRPEAMVNAVKTGRSNPQEQLQNPWRNYKTGWHTTWFGKKVFLRSSAEFEYAEKLDDQQIYYEVEALRIPYTSTDGKEHIYIPDFFIPQENKIVEVKGQYFYEQSKELVDLRLQSCRERGFQTELVIV